MAPDGPEMNPYIAGAPPRSGGESALGLALALAPDAVAMADPPMVVPDLQIHPCGGGGDDRGERPNRSSGAEGVAGGKVEAIAGTVCGGDSSSGRRPSLPEPAAGSASGTAAAAVGAGLGPEEERAVIARLLGGLGRSDLIDRWAGPLGCSDAARPGCGDRLAKACESVDDGTRDRDRER